MFVVRKHVSGLYVCVALALLLTSLLTGCSAHASNDNGLLVAAVGPLTGPAAPRGKDLQRAVEMAADEINAAGGINGRLIQVKTYDDGDQPARARELARQIANSPALAVLGQVASSAGVAAGEVYKEQNIPAITGAASEHRVTAGNDWFFRLFRDARGQGQFLADYARYRFGAREIAVIREKGTAGEEFATALRDRAKTQGIRVAADLEFEPALAKDAKAMDQLAAKLTKLPKSDIVVLGSQYAEAPSLLRALRDKLGLFTAMGYSSLATDGLPAALAEHERERHVAPGYYTDNFYVAAPQLGDVAEYEQSVYGTRYRARYRALPSPEAVRWYEAAQLIFTAMKTKNITGRDRQANRRRIRDWLAGLNDPYSAAKGIAGPIYFDKDHNAQRGISVGVFSDGRLISAPVQLVQVNNPDTIPGWDRLVSNGMVINAQDTKLIKTPVVYAGIGMNSLDNIDVRANTFAADFFLWFRYQDDLNLDTHEVEFPTVVSGATLGRELGRRSHGGFTTVSYHVKGVFRADYEFSRFPFDQQSLRIPIQFHNSNSYSMILAYADQPLRGPNDATGEPADAILASRLWRLKNQLFFRDVVAYRSSLGESTPAGQSTVEVNRINADATIKRDVLGFAVKNFLPLLTILVAVMVGYALAPDVINPRVSIGVTALLTTSVLYQKQASDLPTVTYITGMDYVFFAFFAFCVTFLLLTVFTYETNKAKKHKLTSMLTYAGAGITVLGLAAILLFVWNRYWSGSEV
jgi:ABC-type branched-subunit amino acid transport system substrate-binding protein